MPIPGINTTVSYTHLDVYKRQPATTANLGPGFDSFGCALSLYNTYTFSFCDHLEIQGCPSAYCNEENLTVVAFKKVLEALGEPWHGLKMSVQAEIPVSRGLGSSAAMIVAGAAGANMLYGSRLPAEALFAICTALEGHPDNVAPALFGGLTVSLMDHNRPLTVNYPIHPSLRFVALIPDFTLRTQKARSVLPDQVPRQDAVFNASRTGFLPRALELGDERLICAALQDRLHEPYLSLIHILMGNDSKIKKRNQPDNRGNKRNNDRNSFKQRQCKQHGGDQ